MPGRGARVREGLVALRPRVEPDEDQLLRQWLTEAQRQAFLDLPAHDRGHLVRVARTLAHRAPTNTDLIVAGLLHDLGKVDNGHRVRLIDRVANVLIGRASPLLLGWLARPDATWWRAGITLVVHHPEIGGERAARLGCSDQVVWLIKHHEDSIIDDPELRLLADVDQATP
jgi:hypothetical protein